MAKSQFTYSKSHYVILDGLRGVAALLVVWYHIFEGFAFAGATNGASDGMITTFNHGYLAVDFFFMLSGFVISYAYDDRWEKMTIPQFFKRRLLRLHPMVIIGAFLGTLAFYLGGYANWNGEVAQWHNILLAAVLGMLLIPAIPGCSNDVRGNGEMFPLNGPSWSLFFEYLGNIIYAMFIRRLSNRWLKWLTLLLGLLFAIFATANLSGYGSIGVGWTLDKVNFCGGLLRMLFPFTLGMVIQRSLFATAKTPAFLEKISDSTAFATSSLILFVLFSVPFLGADGALSMNGLYEFCTIAAIFPLIIIMGAGASVSHRGNKRWSTAAVSSFLGRLSYPLYIIHYPVMYLFYSWLIKNEIYTLSQGWPAVVCVIAAILLITYLALRLYEWIEIKLKRL